MSLPVLLKPARRPARGLVVATRVPPLPKEHTGNPFTSIGDVVAECSVVDDDGKRCGYSCQGERAEVGKALREHHRLFHSESISVALLNHARQ